jgi:hypothetical protein
MTVDVSTLKIWLRFSFLFNKTEKLFGIRLDFESLSRSRKYDIRINLVEEGTNE